jgi:uncharacterized membrane protein YhaH (DUF805 family)
VGTTGIKGHRAGIPADDKALGNAASLNSNRLAAARVAAVNPKRCPMTFVEAISSCFRNYANFSSRAVRSEYWYWFLFVAIVFIVFGAIDESLYPGPLEMGPFSYLTMAVVLALILPTLAVSVRRLHDIDRTGWWVLIGATAIGTLILIYWACLLGTSGSNRFG